MVDIYWCKVMVSFMCANKVLVPALQSWARPYVAIQVARICRVASLLALHLGCGLLILAPSFRSSNTITQAFVTVVRGSYLLLCHSRSVSFIFHIETMRGALAALLLYSLVTGWAGWIQSCSSWTVPMSLPYPILISNKSEHAKLDIESERDASACWFHNCWFWLHSPAKSFGRPYYLATFPSPGKDKDWRGLMRNSWSHV